MTKRPNIVLFNPDQWRGDVMGHLGNPAAVTPNLDRIVAEDAVSFRYAFCQNPVCTPSRCSFMTGWYPHTNGNRTMRHMLHPERGETNLLKLLKDNGYFVWWGGKNDLVPSQNGFQEHCNVKFKATDEDYARWRHCRPAQQSDWRGEMHGSTYYGFLQGKLDCGDDDIYCDGDWANVLGARDFIEQYNNEQPFCIYLPLSFPHPSYKVEESFYNQIDTSKLPKPAPLPENPESEPGTRRRVRENMHIKDWPEERWREVQALYYGMCARSDNQFGIIIDALKSSGLYENTAIFFFSDHGDYTGDYRMVEKMQNTFEDCLTRVPFICKPPVSVPTKAGIRNGLAELIDFPATVHDFCEIEPGYSHFGRSLRPVLADELEEWRDAVFCEGGRLVGEKQCTEAANNPTLNPKSQYWPRQSVQMDLYGADHGKAAMCRTKDFKYVKRLYETDQLFDLRTDPQELHNRINDPNYTEILHQLERRLLSWYMETCDVVPWSIDNR